MAGAVVVAAALAHCDEDAVREPLRREEQRAAKDVDDRVPLVQKVLDRVRQKVQVQIGKQHERDAAQTPT